MKTITPYIYKLTFIPDGRIYIGSRANSSGCHPDEFWVKYFTSSKYIKELRESHGDSTAVWGFEILEVVNNYETLKDVHKRENKFIVDAVRNLGRMMVINKRWVENDSKDVYSNAGTKHSDETKRLISERATGRTPYNKGVPTPKETIEKIRMSNIAVNELRKAQGIDHPHTGKPKTPEQIEKYKAARRANADAREAQGLPATKGWTEERRARHKATWEQKALDKNRILQGY